MPTSTGRISGRSWNCGGKTAAVLNREPCELVDAPTELADAPTELWLAPIALALAAPVLTLAGIALGVGKCAGDDTRPGSTRCEPVVGPIKCSGPASDSCLNPLIPFCPAAEPTPFLSS